MARGAGLEFGETPMEENFWWCPDPESQHLALYSGQSGGRIDSEQLQILYSRYNDLLDEIRLSPEWQPGQTAKQIWDSTVLRHGPWSPCDLNVLNWFAELLANYEASDLSTLTASYLFGIDGTAESIGDLDGAHGELSQSGMSSLINVLHSQVGPNVEFVFNSPIINVDCSHSNHIIVRSSNAMEWNARHFVCTLPLGVLQANTINSHNGPPNGSY